MQQLRALLLRYRALATLVAIAALCMKIVVPAGYMIGPNSEVLTIQICNGAMGDQSLSQLVIPLKQDGRQPDSHQGKDKCPFASLSMPSVIGTDAALIALALVYILALGLAPVRPSPPKRISNLRPPLRGPPVRQAV